MGDLVQALPAVARLRAAAGAASLLVGASHAAFARATGLFDAVLAFDDVAAYHGALARRAAVLADAARRARGARPDVCVAFKAAPVYAALAAASGARRRVGLTRGGPAARLLTRAVRVTDFTHWEARYAALADAGLAALADAAEEAGVGPVAGSTPAGHWTWPSDESPDVDLLRDAGDSTLRIGVAPGGARNAKADLPQKRWPAAQFAEVATALAGRHPAAEFVLFGAPSDRADADAFLRAAPGLRVRDLVGRTSVLGARAAIGRCALFLCNDSALLHVAATTDTPTVAVFGPTDPRAICPRAPSVRAVWRPARAAACYDDVTGRVAPCVAPCCMARVTPADVLDAARAALGDGALGDDALGGGAAGDGSR